MERREPKSQRWLRLTKAPQQELDFADTGVREKKEYEYRVIAVNEAGPGEPSPPSEMVVAKPSRGEWYRMIRSVIEEHMIRSLSYFRTNLRIQQNSVVD